jgi:hypothetical protein
MGLRKRVAWIRDFIVIASLFVHTIYRWSTVPGGPVLRYAPNSKSQSINAGKWGRFVAYFKCLAISLSISGRNSVVECQLPKLKVASSTLVARSTPHFFLDGIAMITGSGGTGSQISVLPTGSPHPRVMKL